MVGHLAALVLLCLDSLVSASARVDCAGNISTSCPNQQEDESLMQLGRLGVQHGIPSGTRGSFVQNSKPYLGKGSDLTGAEAGALMINEDGVWNTYFLPGATTIDGGRTVKYTPPYRFYLMKSPTTDYSNKDNFFMPIFPGKTFSVDIDFKRDGPGCGCNLNFYLVSMPWPTAGKDNDYYCDAQCFPGMGCCAEFDMNEGNMDVQQITNHACTRDYNCHPNWQCNKWGDPEVKTHTSDFGPGDGYTINSRKPFTFSQTFDVNGDDFTFTTTMSQEGRQVVQRMGPGSRQLNAMLTEIRKGMVFVTGYWFARDMNWMDGELCGNGPEHCNMNPAFISNWRLTSNGGPAPPSPVPAPPASGGCCKFGADCGDCGDDNTGWCHQSAANCDICTGTFDASAPAPSCNGDAPAPVPTPPAPPTPPSPSPVPAIYCNPHTAPAQYCPNGDVCPDCGRNACPCP